jgi:hypothetical protein
MSVAGRCLHGASLDVCSAVQGIDPSGAVLCALAPCSKACGIPAGRRDGLCPDDRFDVACSLIIFFVLIRARRRGDGARGCLAARSRPMPGICWAGLPNEPVKRVRAMGVAHLRPQCGRFADGSASRLWKGAGIGAIETRNIGRRTLKFRYVLGISALGSV